MTPAQRQRLRALEAEMRAVPETMRLKILPEQEWPALSPEKRVTVEANFDLVVRIRSFAA